MTREREATRHRLAARLTLAAVVLIGPGTACHDGTAPLPRPAAAFLVYQASRTPEFDTVAHAAAGITHAGSFYAPCLPYSLTGRFAIEGRRYVWRLDGAPAAGCAPVPGDTGRVRYAWTLDQLPAGSYQAREIRRWAGDVPTPDTLDLSFSVPRTP